MENSEKIEGTIKNGEYRDTGNIKDIRQYVQHTTED